MRDYGYKSPTLRQYLRLNIVITSSAVINDVNIIDSPNRENTVIA